MFYYLYYFIYLYLERGEKRERGDYRNYYKGHMDEINGEMEVGEGGGFSWGGVEGWGEKAANCN